MNVFTLANGLTLVRILCSLSLLFFPALSPMFYALYLAAGITDMIDGPVARKTNTVSEFGARLDTAADFVLVVVCLLKLVPAVTFPRWVLIWTGVIALIKAVNIVSGLVMRKKLILPHTIANKVAGALLFALPLTLGWIDLKYSAVVICAAATFAAVQEGHFIRTGKYDPENKT